MIGPMRNMKMNMRQLVLVALIVLGLSSTAEAGSQASSEPQLPVEDVISFAKKVEREMAARGARVFILARAGRPAAEMPEGFHYSHVAFGVYSMIKTADGRTVPGYAIYNLYQEDNKLDSSKLVQDYPVDFFAGVYELKTGIIIPKPELQKRLLKVIASDTYRNLHNPRYSVLASPYNGKFQNCTEHTLDVINAAIYQTDDARVIKANTRSYYEAQKVNLGPMKLLIGSITKPDVTLSDHKGGVKTASYTTIARYLEKYDLVQEELTITQ